MIAMLLALLSCGAPAQWKSDPATTAEGSHAGDLLDLLPGAGIGFAFIGTSDSDHFQRRRARLAALVNYNSPYDFLAVGVGTEYFKQNDWSTRGYSVSATAHKVEKATGAGIAATVGLLHADGHDRAIADAMVNHRFSADTGGELILQRDLVATRAALEAGVTHAFIAGSLDHAFSDRWTGIALAGAQRFSDGNDRAHLRGWLIYTLVPEYGLSLQARARGYENSQRGSAFYFNPERYETADIGLRLRKSLGGWRLFALLAAGEERIDRTTTNPTRFGQLNLDRVLEGDIRVGMQYAYSRAAAENSGSLSSGYAWHYLRVFVVAPL
jgi:hypothetical protein